MGTATSAYAVSFVSTLCGEPLLASDPPGIAEVGKIDPATGAYTTAEKTQSNQQTLTDKNCIELIPIAKSKFRARTTLSLRALLP
jgi:hypothetical protein